MEKKNLHINETKSHEFNTTRTRTRIDLRSTGDMILARHVHFPPVLALYTRLSFDACYYRFPPSLPLNTLPISVCIARSILFVACLLPE
jgi:hypothetical protein